MSNLAERLSQSSVRVASRVLLRKHAPAPIELKALHRVLVVRVDDRVGNVLLTTPLLRALREGLPHARIDWLISRKRFALVDGLFLADALVPWDKARNLKTLWTTLQQVRRARYDLVIDASHFDAPSTTSALITRFSGAPVRIGAARNDAERFFTHPVPVPADTRYDVAVKLQLLLPLGIPDRGVGLETVLGTSDAEQARVREILERVGTSPGRFFVVNPGARKHDRRFEPERLGVLVGRVAEATGLLPLVVWGPGEQELAQATALASGGRAIVAPPNDLSLLASLLRVARLLVTNDTGPMHLGVACRTPVLALFLQADAERWGHPVEGFSAIEVSATLEDEALLEARRLVALSEARLESE